MARDEEEKKHYDPDGDDEMVNKEDDDIYEKEDIEEQMDADEIEPGEAGFMEGYDNPNLIKTKKCRKCGKELKGVDLEKCHEEEVDGKIVWVCDECLEEK